MASAQIDSSKGTYILWLYMPYPSLIEIGKLGTFSLLAGWYGYVGSAMGSGGLQGRLKHHFTPIRHPHWHIDYLRLAASSKQVWAIADVRPREHVWASILGRMPDATVPIRRFGASDCQCETHLFHFDVRPDFTVFRPLSGDSTFVSIPDYQ